MTVDQEKVRQKLHFMRAQLKELERFQNMTAEEFTADSILPAAATRMLQVAIEAMLDLCAHVTVREGWGLPKSYREAVSLVAQHGLIPRDLVDIYKHMARFRNRVVHLYDDVDDLEVLKIIRTNLKDFRPFMAAVIERYLPG
ncbi:MAG: DUF86 domain-containing protein [Syntrophomonadaceae bacterium]|nr:DUF86 domain-containing protein [Syntrophomonadaceae bacterium]